MDSDEELLHNEGVAFIGNYLKDGIDRASEDGVNPAAALYGLLEAGMQICEAHFPEHANQLFASASQMVFESHQQPESKQ